LNKATEQNDGKEVCIFRHEKSRLLNGLAVDN
jgi:hypothetical protein